MRPGAFLRVKLEKGYKNVVKEERTNTEQAYFPQARCALRRKEKVGINNGNSNNDNDNGNDNNNINNNNLLSDRIQVKRSKTPTIALMHTYV